MVIDQVDLNVTTNNKFDWQLYYISLFAMIIHQIIV